MRLFYSLKTLPFPFKGTVLAMLFTLLCLQDGFSQHAPAKEYQVKAVFLFNFSRFITWPAAAFTSQQSPFVIGILGEDPFGIFLEQTVAGETVMEHPIIVQRFKTAKEINDCHVLYITVTPGAIVEKLVDTLGNRSILTVSDSHNFTSFGGMVAFSTQNNKIRLHINANAAKKAGLTISSKLLRLAKIDN